MSLCHPRTEGYQGLQLQAELHLDQEGGLQGGRLGGAGFRVHDVPHFSA